MIMSCLLRLTNIPPLRKSTACVNGGGLTGVHSGGTIRAAILFGSIEELCEHEDDIICHSGCDDMADVARCYLEESGQLGELPAHLQNYIDYAAYGRDMELEGTFVVTNHGVYEIIR